MLLTTALLNALAMDSESLKSILLALFAACPIWLWPGAFLSLSVSSARGEPCCCICKALAKADFVDLLTSRLNCWASATLSLFAWLASSSIVGGAALAPLMSTDFFFSFFDVVPLAGRPAAPESCTLYMVWPLYSASRCWMMVERSIFIEPCAWPGASESPCSGVLNPTTSSGFASD